MNKMMNQEKRKREGGRRRGREEGGRARRKEGRKEEGKGGGGKGGRKGREGPTQYIWVVFEPPCHLLPEHGEMVLYLLFVVIETLPMCVCVCVGGEE